MTWPVSDASTTHLDAASDDPSQARADLKTLADNVALIRAHVSVFVQGLIDDADAATARTTLAAAKSGANTDITSVVAVTGVTAAAGDSSSKLATTEFVAGAGAKRGPLSGNEAIVAQRRIGFHCMGLVRTVWEDLRQIVRTVPGFFELKPVLLIV